MTNKLEKCKIAWKEKYNARLEFEREWEKLLEEQDREHYSYPKYRLLYWRCPCCNKILRKRQNKSSRERTEQIILFCSHCEYQYAMAIFNGLY